MANKYDDSVLHVVLNMPVACAVWYDFSEFVSVSNSMRKILNMTENLADVYSFSKVFKSVFGDFLDDASNIVKMRGTYSATHYLYTLTMKYDAKNNLYTLYITDLEKKETDMLDNLPVYVWKRDNNLKLVYCNKKYAAALELNPEQAVEKNACFPVTTATNGLSLAQLALATGKTQTKRQHVVINGTRHTLEFREFPFNSRFLQFGYATDVTKEEEIKSDFDTYKQQTEETFNHISVAIAIFDANTNLVFANQAMKNMFDVDESFIMSNPTCARVIDWLIHENKIMDVNDHDELKNRVLDYFVNVIEPQHHIIHTPSCRSINMVVCPNLSGGLIFVMEDISDKMDIERKYNAIIAAQKETLENLPEGIMIFSQDNRIRIINKKVGQMLNLDSCEQFIGTHINEFFTKCSDVFDGEYTADILISKLITASLQRASQDSILHMKDGKHINISYTPLPDGSNLVTIVDISLETAYNTTKEQNEALKQKIIQMKYGFIQNVTCELTTPINAIMNFVEVLQEQYFGILNDKQLIYCKHATKAAEKLLSLIDTMLWLGKFSQNDVQLKYERINTKDIINTCLLDFHNLISEKNAEISIDINSNSEQMYCDAELFLLVLKTVVKKAIMEIKQNQKISIHIYKNEGESDYIDMKIKWVGRGIKNQQINILRSVFTEDNMLYINTLEDMDMMLICRAMLLVRGMVLAGMCDDFATEIICRFGTN